MVSLFADSHTSKEKNIIDPRKENESRRCLVDGPDFAVAEGKVELRTEFGSYEQD